MTSLTRYISVRLKIARMAAGFKTSKEFAEKHNIPLSTYCQHETGKRPLSIEQLFHYSTLTFVEPAWLLTGQGNPCTDGNNKAMEQKILEDQEKFSSHGELVANAIPLISDKDRFVYVNMSLFKAILHEIIPFILKGANFHIEESIHFCFDLYNRVITLDAKEDERIKIIQIGLKSFFDGLYRGMDVKKLAGA
jgi:hypothetical protein